MSIISYNCTKTRLICLDLTFTYFFLVFSKKSCDNGDLTPGHSATAWLCPDNPGKLWKKLTCAKVCWYWSILLTWASSYTRTDVQTASMVSLAEWPSYGAAQVITGFLLVVYHTASTHSELGFSDSFLGSAGFKMGFCIKISSDRLFWLISWSSSLNTQISLI